MERINRRRAAWILAFFLIVTALFSGFLYKIQIIDTGGKTDNSTTFTTYTRVKAARGDILDKNGNVLVSNRASYDLAINHYVLLSANGTTDYLYQLAKRCQEQGIEYNEHFPVSKERPFTYTLNEYNSAYQNYFQTFLEYLEGLDSDITAPVLIEKLRLRYNLPTQWTDEEARQVLGLYYELTLRNCTSLPNYVLLTDATDEELSAVVELSIPGMNVEASTVREYNTRYAAHVLGYVGAMTPSQWEKYEKIDGYSMDNEVGQDGLEAVYEEYLHGVDGLREDVVALDGTLISTRYVVEPKAGSNVEVSIDINLQMAAEDQMASVIEGLRNQEPYADGTLPDGTDAEGGAVVAIDVKTGQILTCASYPTYDLSTFFENYEEITKDPYKPLYNRALLGTYPPGSTYKMVMVTAAINNKVIDSETTTYDRGKFTLSGTDFTVYCLSYWSGWSHGTINAAQALMHSCNYFFYDLGSKMSISQIDATAKGFGLGEKTGVELPEYVGHRANPETKAELHKGDDRNWYLGDQILAAIGQSENRFTPIQLGVYAATLANRGNRYSATFMSRVVSSDYQELIASNEKTLLSTMEISDEAYQAYSEGMHLVTSSDWGTAYTTFANYPIPVAAKTGTAQHDLSISSDASDHGAFVCYAPVDDPQIAIAVYVERGGHGSTLATIARSVLDVYFQVGEIGDVNIYENGMS